MPWKGVAGVVHEPTQAGLNPNGRRRRQPDFEVLAINVDRRFAVLDGRELVLCEGARLHDQGSSFASAQVRQLNAYPVSRQLVDEGSDIRRQARTDQVLVEVAHRSSQ